MMDPRVFDPIRMPPQEAPRPAKIDPPVSTLAKTTFINLNGKLYIYLMYICRRRLLCLNDVFFLCIYMGMRPNFTTTHRGRGNKKTGNSIPRPSMISRKIRRPWSYHWAETSSGPIGQVQIPSYYFYPNFLLGGVSKHVVFGIRAHTQIYV